MASHTISAGPDEVNFTLCDKRKTLALYRRFGRSIRIGRRDYQLVFCLSIKFEGAEQAGLCMPSAQQIFIDASVDEQEMTATLMHEVGHAILLESGFRQRDDFDLNLEEQIVEVISQSIAGNYRLSKR